MTKGVRHDRCPEDVLGWIPQYADGGLSDAQRARVESHLAECADCRDELDIVSGAHFEFDEALPDAERMFNEITARIRAGEPESLGRVIPIDRSRSLRGADQDRPALVDIEFSESATMRDISIVLRSVDGEIVSGPTTRGVYRVRLKTIDLARHGSRDEAIAAIAAQLQSRDDGIAVFVAAVP
jgi:hypothetical protein